MQLDDDIRARLEGRLALLVAARNRLLATPAGEIISQLEHALALRGLESDIARYRGVLVSPSGSAGGSPDDRS